MFIQCCMFLKIRWVVRTDAHKCMNAGRECAKFRAHTRGPLSCSSAACSRERVQKQLQMLPTVNFAPPDKLPTKAGLLRNNAHAGEHMRAGATARRRDGATAAGGRPGPPSLLLVRKRWRW